MVKRWKNAQTINEKGRSTNIYVLLLKAGRLMGKIYFFLISSTNVWNLIYFCKFYEGKSYFPPEFDQH